jgi:hypothetical protein
MFKKSFNISTAIIIGIFWATGAYSWPLPSTGGWPSATYNTITIEQLVKKLNLSTACDDDSTEEIEYCEYLHVDVKLLEAQANQCNGGLNCGGLGTPFGPLDASIESNIGVEDCTFDANGNATCTKVISNEEILAALEYHISDLLQNPNWSWDPETVVAPTIEIFVQTFGLDKKGTGINNVVEGDSRIGCFQLPQGFTVGVETEYDLICEEQCYTADGPCSPRLPFYR